MSIKLMSIAWDLDIPQSEKMVLLCLCDFANDEGRCWPSIKRVAEKCSTGERTVQRSIRKLQERELLAVNVGGGRKNCNEYRIKTPPQCHPATVTPPPINPVNDDINPATVSQNPATVTPEPSGTTKEPSSNNSLARKPDDLDLQIWNDWKRVRKKPITATVMAGMQREADKLGWSVSQAITHAAESSWQGFKAEWIKGQANERQQPSNYNTAELTRRKLAGLGTR